MSSSSHSSDQVGPSHRHVEMGTAAAIALIGVIAAVGGLNAGIGWAVEGPQAGFFPFWVAMAVILASAVNFARGFLARGRNLFSEWGQLAQVGKVVAPTAVYVVVVPWLGIYLSSALLVAGFMRWIGRFSWLLVAAVSIALPIITYMTFEKWFLVPLPKGPIEDMLGL